MKKTIIIFAVAFSLSLLFISIITYAKQTNLPNYYPSPSGTYTKVQLINSGVGPNEYETAGNPNACFCAQYPNNTTGINPTTRKCDTGEIVSGHLATYNHAGTIFADPVTNYLEICKSDGSVASFPGACFNRFGTSVSSPACPTNYQQVNISTGVQLGSSQNIVISSWTCCYTGLGSTSAITPPAAGAALITKSGCFATYSSSTPDLSTGFPDPPPYCNPLEAATNLSTSYVDANAYDISCDNIDTSDLPYPVYKRNCCFNSTGTPTGNPTSIGQLGHTSICISTPPHRPPTTTPPPDS